MTNSNYNIDSVRIFQNIEGTVPSKGCDDDGSGNGLRKKNKKKKSDEISKNNADEDINLGEDEEHFIDYSV
jgi:hypothetical protein